VDGSFDDCRDVARHDGRRPNRRANFGIAASPVAVFEEEALWLDTHITRSRS